MQHLTCKIINLLLIKTFHTIRVIKLKLRLIILPLFGILFRDFLYWDDSPTNILLLLSIFLETI